MDHDVRLFVGHPRVLARYQAIVGGVRLFALSAGASLAVLSIDDDLQDALHRGYGTGEWLAQGPSLTTTDLAFAARTSEAGALAFVQTSTVDGDITQCAALWVGGDVAMKPTQMDQAAAGNRARATWPINAALRGLGIKAAQDRDEFDTFGLGLYRHHADITTRAFPLAG